MRDEADRSGPPRGRLIGVHCTPLVQRQSDRMQTGAQTKQHFLHVYTTNLLPDLWPKYKINPNILPNSWRWRGVGGRETRGTEQFKELLQRRTVDQAAVSMEFGAFSEHLEAKQLHPPFSLPLRK